MRKPVFIAMATVMFGIAARAGEVVVIGDSLSCGPFGRAVVSNLAQSGESVTLYCAVSSAPANWLKGKNPPGQACQTMTSSTPRLQPCSGTGQMPSLSALVDAHPNARFIVGLGTNSLLAPRADRSYLAMAQRLQSRGCKWIGPPHLHPSESKGFPSGRIATEESHLDSFYASLFTAIAPLCRVTDSREITKAGTPGFATVDGVHRTAAAGKSWADEIAPCLQLQDVTACKYEPVRP